MISRTIGSLTDKELLRTFDSGSFLRGKPYAHAGRVTIEHIDPDERAASAVVRGSGREVYSTSIELRDTRAGGVQVVATCSCPVAYSCKHAVAVVIAIRGALEPFAPEPDVRVPTAARIPEAAWKTALAPLVDRGDATQAGSDWALQIDIAALRYQGDASITARPMRRGARGAWIKTGATWTDVESAQRWARGDIAQVSALAELEAAVKAPSTYGRRTDGSVDLSGLTRDAWRAFDQLAAAGVTLLGPGGAEVEIATEPVIVSLDVAPADGGGLEVGAVVGDGVSGQDWREGRSALLGSPAHGLATWDEGRVTRVRLVPLARPLDDTLRVLVSTRRVIPVPESDAPEFLRDFYPRLQRAVGDVTVDPTIAVPEVVPPRLSVTIEHDGLTTELTWGFAYDLDGEVVRKPLSPGSERFRDRAAELAVLEAFVPPEVGLPLTTTDASGRVRLAPHLRVEDYDAVILTRDLVPALEAADVDVQIGGDPPAYRFAEAPPVVHVALDDGTRRDWFDLAVAVSIEGEQIPFGPLFAALAAGKTHLVLPTGTYLRIDSPDLLRLRELIEEARELTDRRSEQLRVNRHHAGLWDELVRLGVVDRQSAAWQRSIGALTSIDDIPVPETPEGLAAELRPYQREGFAWLSFLADHGLGGILADDMGLGKTVQALAMVVRQVARGAAPFLVVAPTSVVANWVRETQRFAPGLTVAAISQTYARRGTELADAVAGADIVITSYALFRLENDAYADRTWAGLLLDEAQFVKNHQGKTYQCARRIDAPFKLAITGTPLENSLMDLWSMLSIVAPGLYPDPQRFAQHYQRPIESGKAPERLELLRRRIRPLMRRRTKDEVASDLPPKTEQVLEVTLSPRHARVYQTHLQRERQKVLGLLGDESNDHRFEVLSSLTRLRQLSLDPALVDDAYDDIGSAKIDLLLEHLQEVTAEGHRALVFSQFTGFLARVRARLDDAGLTHAYLDGRTRNRAAAVESFTSGERSVFVISLKAGGVGLNLTEADYCYVLDPWWNPATEAQAVDRAHRIGQTRPVMVYRLVSAGTIEEKVMELKARKAELFDAVMTDGAALSGALSGDDIRGLLSS